jgi:hypothetical protein
MATEQTTRRFRVCTECGEVFYSVRSAKLHTDGCADGADYESITAEVQE